MAAVTQIHHKQTLNSSNTAVTRNL